MSYEEYENGDCTVGKRNCNFASKIFYMWADSFGQLSNGLSNSIISGIVYWLIAAIVMGILFIITGVLIIGIGYQVGKSTGNIVGISSASWLQ